jgi:hypothetical protein
MRIESLAIVGASSASAAREWTAKTAGNTTGTHNPVSRNGMLFPIRPLLSALKRTISFA